MQRRLPAALRRRRERAVAEDGAEDGGLEGEAEAEGAQWLGMCVAHTRPLGAGRAQGRQRRAQVAGGGRGVEPRRERRRGDAPAQRTTPAHAGKK